MPKSRKGTQRMRLISLPDVRPEAWRDPPSGSTIELRRLYPRGCLSISPPVHGLVRALPTVRHELAADSGGEISPAFETVFSQDTDIDDALLCSAGLEEVVAAWLVQQGYRVLRRDAPDPLPHIDPEEITLHVDRADRLLLNSVRRHDRAWFRVGPNVDPGWLIAQVSAAWPEKRIVVCSTRREDAVRVARHLATHGLPVTLVLDGEPDSSERIFVSTYSRLGSGPAGTARRDIFFAFNADEIFCEAGIYALRAAKQARVYGFVRQHQRLAPRTLDNLTKEFGREVVIPAHGRRALAIAVATTRIVGGPPLMESVNPLDLLRHGVWQNAVRNRRIARLATALAAGDRPTLERQFGAVYQELGRTKRHHVVVLVENVEHGLALTGRLPTWPVVVGENISADWLSVEQRAKLLPVSRLDPDKANQLIVTASAIGAVGVPDVLVRADAGIGLPSLPRDLSVPQDSPRQHLLIVDLCDAHDRRLLQRSRRRKKAYAAAGWLSQDRDWGKRALEQWIGRHQNVEVS